MQIKDIESTLVKYFREPNLFPKHKQSYDGRLQTFSTLCQRLHLRLGPVFENYINYIYENGLDILFLYQVLLAARQHVRAPHETVIDYARKKHVYLSVRDETENRRCQLQYEMNDR